MRALPPALRRYVTGVIVAGVLALLILRPGRDAFSITGIAFFVAMALIAEAIPVQLPTGGATISVSFVIIYASILLFGAREAAWIAAIGTLRLKDITGGVPPHVVLFNRSLLAISAGIAGIVYQSLGGIPLATDFRIVLLPTVLAGVSYLTINTALVVGVLSIQQSVPPWSMFLANFRWTLPNLIVFQPLGLLLARVYTAQGIQAVALFIIPLLVARYSFQLYTKMRKAYLETILTLTASLDAKDPSTLGHSERVSNYAVEIGRKMRLEYHEIELLRYVGMLHDVGKIGIRDAILKKPGIFTEAEYEEMKRHPIIGAQILSNVRLLGGAASWVRYHHERFDGFGFPDNLKGEEIPLGARIIAVADSLDAMTSLRLYKSPLSWDEAIREMARCRGTQFDPQVIDALLQVSDNLRPKAPALAVGAQEAASGKTEVDRP